MFWPPDAKSWLIRKDPDAGEDWRQEEKGAAEDEMVGWHHQLDRHEFEQTLGDGEGQGGLVCCDHGVTKSRTWLSNWTTNKVSKRKKRDTKTVGGFHKSQFPITFTCSSYGDSHHIQWSINGCTPGTLMKWSSGVRFSTICRYSLHTIDIFSISTEMDFLGVFWLT